MRLEEIITLMKSNMTEENFTKLMDNMNLDGCFDLEDEDNEDSYPIKELVNYLITKTTIKFALGSKGIYPHVEYGWDGGNAIDTNIFNLKPITDETVDAFGGPIASLVNRVDISIPGFAIHHYDADDSFEIIVYQ